MSSLENAELQVGLAYAVASLYFTHLLTQGIDPSDHPIRQELDRIQLYFKKVRSAAEEVTTRGLEQDRVRIDAEAAKRIVQHYAVAAEASAQRRLEAEASRAQGRNLAPLFAEELVAPETGESPAKKRRLSLAQPAQAVSPKSAPMVPKAVAKAAVVVAAAAAAASVAAAASASPSPKVAPKAKGKAKAKAKASEEAESRTPEAQAKAGPGKKTAKKTQKA